MLGESPRSSILYINLILIYFQPPAEGQVSAMSGILGKLPKWKNDSVSIAR